MSFSVRVSTDDVASSKIRIVGFAIAARAIDNSCLSPCDKFSPLTVNSV